jgi:glycosyltransferase involved in cell wall biosynthesis
MVWLKPWRILPKRSMAKTLKNDTTQSPTQGPVIFCFNTPTPYGQEMLDALHALGPTFGFYRKPLDAKQNVSWSLKLPKWVQQLPAGGWASVRHIIHTLNGAKPHLILLGGYQLPGHLWLLLWARLKGIPVWFWLENPQPHSGRGIWFKTLLRHVLNTLILRQASGIAGVDTRAVAAYRRYHPHAVHTPYAINPAAYVAARKNAPKPSPTAPLKCVCVGQLIDRKGIPELLAAFRTISPKQATLSIVGTGPYQTEVKAFCAQTGHQYLGFVQPSDLPAVFAAHDVFVFPSRYDGWGVVVLEAMAAGLPVISTPLVGAFADLATPGQHGLSFKVGDAAALHAAVNFYLNNRNAVSTHGQAAQQALLASTGNTSILARHLVRLPQL